MHIKHPHHEREALCGAEIRRDEPVFLSIDQAWLSLPEDMQTPCPACAKSVMDVFRQAG